MKPTNTLASMIAGLLCIALLAGCQRDADTASKRVLFQHFEVNNGALVTVHSRTTSDATVNAAGDLVIAGKPVATTPAQRQLLQRYYTEVQGIRSDAIATGKQGMALASKALGEVIGGLMAGNPDRIGGRIDKEASKMEDRAQQICTRLGAIRSAQEALATELPAFRPYATIRAEQVTDCLVKAPPVPPAPPLPPTPPTTPEQPDDSSAAAKAGT